MTHLTKPAALGDSTQLRNPRNQKPFTFPKIAKSLVAARVDSADHGVISLERLQGELLLGLHPLLTHLLNFTGEDGLWCGRAVDAVGLDRDDDTAVVLQEQVGVQANDTSLVRLGNIGEDAVNHGNKHAILERVTGVLDDRDDVGAVSGHVDKITARTVGELDSVDGAWVVQYSPKTL